MMRSLSDAIPRDLFREMFNDVRENVIATDVRSYLRNEVDSSTTALLYVWDEAVARGKVINPSEMGKFYPDRKAKVYSLVRRTLKLEPFKDAFATEFYNEHSEQPYFGQPANFPFAQFELVHCYPNDIHIADVTLVDLTQPVEDVSPVAPRSHKGLKVFPVFLDRLKEVAKERGALRISLVAASRETHEVFSRYGFKPSDAPASRMAFNQLGFSHAMILPV